MSAEQFRHSTARRAVRVLVVQPDRRLADALERRFIGHSAIDVAFDGSSALAKASAGGYDVVVLDQDLPRWPREVSPQRVRAVSDARILLLTATGNPALHGTQGADEYLSKPFAVPDLIDRITALADRKAKHRTSGLAGSMPSTEAEVLTLRPIRLLLTEGIALYASALQVMLSNERDMDVVATVLSDVDLGAAAIRAGADVAIVDLDIPGRDALALCQEIRRGAPLCKVIALTGGNLPDARRQAFNAQAHGLINKHSPASVLLDGIRRVAAGEKVLDPRFTLGITRNLGNTLTLRELDLLRRAANGNSVRELADQLSLSQGTVRNYLSRIMGKLNARNRIEAIRIARDAGWL
jgi:two-component system, NarL family, response regulator DesR